MIEEWRKNIERNVARANAQAEEYRRRYPERFCKQHPEIHLKSGKCPKGCNEKN